MTNKEGKGDGRAIVFENESSRIAFILNMWCEIESASLTSRGVMNVALSGGRTPVPLYRTLARRKDGLNWKKTHIFLVDERFVPPLDKESNFRIIEEAFLKEAVVPRENIHEVKMGPWSPEEGAGRYEEELRSHFRLRAGQFPCFDLMLLGIGEDGHTASLFPGSSALEEGSRLSIAAQAPKAPHVRITLTLPVINHSDRVLFLVSGVAKAKALKRTVEGERGNTPAALVKPLSGKLFFLCDREAAGLLPKEAYEIAD
ncbi:MAG TPA: 6-phosphogluconolactonase [Syntrophorhabdaceae bacterium]